MFFKGTLSSTGDIWASFSLAHLVNLHPHRQAVGTTRMQKLDAADEQL